MLIGTTGVRGKGMNWSTLGVRSRDGFEDSMFEAKAKTKASDHDCWKNI